MASRNYECPENSVQSAGLAGWERHTKGIGSKLLQKMGYKPGLGLGKNNEGIVDPVELQANKGRSMLGTTRTKRYEDEGAAIKGRLKKGKQQIKNKRARDVQYGSDDDNENDELEEIEDSSADEEGKIGDEARFVSDDDDSQTNQDEDSPNIIAKRLIASNVSLIDQLEDECQTERAKQRMLEQKLSELYHDLKLNQELIENHRGVLSIIQHLETISRNDKLDLSSLWEAMPTTISPATRCHMIQIFALPLLRKTYNKIVIHSPSNNVDDIELERRLFGDIIDVAREWLKTKYCLSAIVDWYLEWKGLLRDHIQTSKRVRYFRRRLLDVMHLSTIENPRDLNSFRYIPYIETSSSGRQYRKVDDKIEDLQPLSFKQLLEQMASENGFLFRPLNGRSHDSKQIYKLEKLDIYIDNKIIFVRQGDQWNPKTLEDVIGMNHTL